MDQCKYMFNVNHIILNFLPGVKQMIEPQNLRRGSVWEVRQILEELDLMNADLFPSIYSIKFDELSC